MKSLLFFKLYILFDIICQSCERLKENVIYVGEMVEVSSNLTSGLKFEHENIVVFRCRVLLPLWSILTRMRISLGMVYDLKTSFVCVRTAYDTS